ncbi:MAG: CoA transferase [Actinobacteria bacterium]|nr:CoA transferase [Actinomycetota bacterium]
MLSDLRVVEGSAFVAAPLGGMTLAQLGADVIRFDQLGGGIDYGRWPLAPNGRSLYWAGLNKGKRSIQLDLRREEGRELATALIAAPGPGGGLFLTNFPPRGWLDYERLRERRDDLIMLALEGEPDGGSALDYTVNSASGFPLASGPRDLAGPLNSLLPSWDLVAGGMAAVGLLAAERRRARSGEGELIRLALSDVAFATVGNLGRIAEAALDPAEPRRDGNHVYGAFGHDFETRDGRNVMVVAISHRQWVALRDATGIAERCVGIELASAADLDTESGRYAARDLIAAVLRPWFAERDLATVREQFAGTGVCWGPYQTFRQLLEEDPRCSTDNPMFEAVEQPGVGTYPMPGSPLRFAAAGRAAVKPAPALGEHTEEILAEILGLSAAEIGRLHDTGVVAGPQ